MSHPIRNGYALAAMMRNSAGPMKDRRAPRGGARNDQRDILDEWSFGDEDNDEDFGDCNSTP